MTVSNYYSKKFSKGIFKTCFICYYCPEVIIKKFLQLTCIVKALGDGSIFSSTSHFKKELALFANIDELKNRKRQYTSLFIKCLQTVFLKGTQPLKYNIVPW